VVSLERLSRIVLVIGIPIIVYLLVNIVRRVRAIRTLDAKLREEEARNPMPPQAALAQLYQKDDR
jgi:hypothetical protein